MVKKIEEEGGEVVTETVATSPPTELQLVLAAINDVSARVSEIEQRVTRSENNQSRIIPSQTDHIQGKYVNSKEAAKILGKSGEVNGLLKQLPQFGNGNVIPTDIFRFLTPKFQTGDTVLINRDSTKSGGSQPWGVLLDQANVVGYGEVRKVTHMTKSGEWKYKVRVPGLTDAMGEGFQEHELLPE